MATQQTMRVIINALIVALEGLRDEGRQMCAESPDETVHAVVESIDETLVSLERYLTTEDVADLQGATETLLRAQRLIGR